VSTYRDFQCTVVSDTLNVGSSVWVVYWLFSGISNFLCCEVLQGI